MARVLVVGTGAVGGYYGACLQRAGYDVTFLARGKNLGTLTSKGLRVTGAMGDIELPDTAATDDAPSGCDLVLLCVKNYDLEEAVMACRDSGGIYLTLQNGVLAPQVASEVVGDTVLAGSTGIVADMPEPGRVHVVSSYAWIRFGEPSGGAVSERARRVESWLDVDGIQPIPVADARVALWEKMALMCAMAGLTTLHQRPMGDLLSRPDTRNSFESIVRECEAIARAYGVPLPDDFFAERMAYALRIDPSAMSSMSRDLARGRSIELENFNGTIVRLAQSLGMPVPANSEVYDQIKSRVAASSS